MLRNRLAGLLLILPVLAGLCVAAYKLGPNPDRAVEQVETKQAPVVEPARAESQNAESSQLFKLFGMYQVAVAKGTVALTPGQYLDSLEQLYVKRGYRRIEELTPNTKVAKKRRSRRKEEVAVKVFQRDDSNGIGNFSATGADADFNSNEVEAEPYTFTTLVVPAANGGSDWASYRIGIDRNKMAQLGQLDGDFPGEDPASIPRPPDLQRTYALKSGHTSMAIYKTSEKSDTALMLLYLKEMPRRGWNLDSAATSAANKVANGVMCFTQGTRSCLIWITPAKEPNTTNVIISSH